jgi:hypothetical protein
MICGESDADTAICLKAQQENMCCLDRLRVANDQNTLAQMTIEYRGQTSAYSLQCCSPRLRSDIKWQSRKIRRAAPQHCSNIIPALSISFPMGWTAKIALDAELNAELARDYLR